MPLEMVWFGGVLECRNAWNSLSREEEEEGEEEEKEEQEREEEEKEEGGFPVRKIAKGCRERERGE